MIARLYLVWRALVVPGIGVAYVMPAALGAGVILLASGHDAAGRFLARRFVAMIERLGPTFIKVGQVVGTRRDFVPAALCEALDSLADSAAPMSPHDVRAALQDLYGQDLGPFEAIASTPLASGSVACVLVGTLRDGRAVAVKLQRPGIRRVMASDLAIVRAIGVGMAWLPPFRGMPVREIVGYVCDAVYAQLDFERETHDLSRLRANLASVPRVWVPAVEHDATRPGAIVMELIPDLDAGAAAKASSIAQKHYAAKTLAAIYRMLFVDGFVHCDMHRGNVYFAHGQVVILDAGFAVTLEDRIRRLFAEFFLSMSLGDGERCARTVIESAATIRPDADLDGFTRGMVDLVARNAGAPAREFSLIGFATELFVLQRTCGLYAASQIVFPLLSLLVIEGTIRDLDPDIDFQREAQPLLMKGRFDAPHEPWPSTARHQPGLVN
ncbi:ABC1 kinase family protein [Mycobacterium sp.]|uniref:ABC1 kinase family protein n=1 Tax=Mycobacterium sp. TaxID=1785 RepID=UPI002C7AE327|nr:AarF/UbiB family protein [Mycobacterium sp.]HTY35349.1 AarF/UbiB family protein [Mycobacterium sp.]